MKKTAIALAIIAASHSLHANADSASSTEIITVIGAPITLTDHEPVNASTNTEADFGDQLDNLAGVSITRNGPVTGLVQYRGLYGDRVGISIDGVNITGAGPNGMDSPLSHVLPEVGLSATLYRGIVPVSAGVQTLGGQLRIQSDAASLFRHENGLSGVIQGALASPSNGQQYQGNAFYKLDNAFVSAAFTHQQRNKREDGNSNNIVNSHYLRNGAKLRAGYEMGDHQVDISYQRLNTNASGTPALAMDIGFIDAAWYKLGYRYTPSEAHTLTINAFGNSNEHAMDNFRQRPLMMPTMSRENNADSKARGVDVSYTTVDGSIEITLGANAHQSENHSVITNPNNAMFFINNFTNTTRDTYSVFGEYLRQHESVNYVLGARYTSVTMDADNAGSSMAMMNDAIATLVNTFNNTEKRDTYGMLDLAATVEVPTGDNVSVFLGVSQKNRAPTYFERYTWLPLGISGGMADGFNYIGNLNIDNETARQIELGLHMEYGGFVLSPRLFYQDIENYIAGTPSTNMAANMFSTMMTGSAPFQWNNTDAVIKGFDVTLEGNLTDNLHLSMVAGYSHANRDDIDDALFRIAPEQLTTQLRWKTVVFDTPLLLKATSELVGAQNNVSSLQSEAQTSGYGLMHLGIEWEMNNTLRISAQLRNAFDKYYAPHLSGVNRVANATLAIGERIPSPGREWQVSLTYQF
ncbi:TonB-dependent receptor [Alteromonas sp. A079]|uniref:TonB-dependent receptor n=1 Tax=Alteromonas sp. A079 TaxID=3410268 RepID=UPI003BA35B91